MHRVSLALVVAVAFLTAVAVHAQPVAKAPTRAEQLTALAVLVRLHNSKPTLKLDNSIARLVYELAGVPPTSRPVLSTPPIDAVLRELQAGHGVDAGPSVRVALEQVCSAAHADVKANLRRLYVAEESNRGEFDRYTRDDAALAVEPRTVNQCAADAIVPYRFEVLSASATAFTARAIGTGDLTGDVWEIDEIGVAKQISSACRDAASAK